VLSDRIGGDGIAGLDPKVALDKHFIELGAVSPDYPYLGSQTRWADRMHYNRTATIIRNGVIELRSWPEGEAWNRALAWLLGYASHVGADFFIHPVVELRVGLYDTHKVQHRDCEMHQDVFIWDRIKGHGVNDAVYLEGQFDQCTNAGGLHHDVKRLWDAMLQATHGDLYSSDPPNFNSWHNEYTMLIGFAASTPADAPKKSLCRDFFAEHALIYPTIGEVRDDYVVGLETPLGPKSYGVIFDAAADYIAGWWRGIAAAMAAGDNDGARDALRAARIIDGNLDNGIVEGAPDRSPYIAWEAIRDTNRLPV
jgi:hypothetical protein